MGKGWWWLTLVLLLPACGGDGRPEALKALDAVPKTAPEHPASFVEAMKTAVLDGRPVVVWRALPESYRDELQGLIREFGQRMDEESWDQGMRVMDKLARVLRDQQALLMQTPMMQGFQAQAPEGADLGEVLGRWGGFLQAVAESEMGRLASLRELDVAVFLEQSGAALMGQMLDYTRMLMAGELAASLDKVASLEVTVKDLEGGLALVQVTVEGEPPSEEVFAQVEGRWLPRSMVDEWESSMQTFRALVGQVGNEERLAGSREFLASVEESLDQMLAAETAAELQELLNKVVFQAMFLAAGGAEGLGLPQDG